MKYRIEEMEIESRYTKEDSGDVFTGIIMFGLVGGVLLYGLLAIFYN